MKVINKQETNEWTDTDLLAGSDCSYGVRAYKIIGGSKYYGSYIYKNGYTLPEAINSLKVIDYTSDSVKLKWESSAGASIIYEELPNGILDELKKKAPKNESGNRTERYHQFLTLDVGEPNLEKQINKVITLFQVSDNMKQFWDNFKKMKMRQIGQTELPFDFDENGHTKD